MYSRLCDIISKYYIIFGNFIFVMKLCNIQYNNIIIKLKYYIKRIEDATSMLLSSKNMLSQNIGNVIKK